MLALNTQKSGSSRKTPINEGTDSKSRGRAWIPNFFGILKCPC